MAAMTLDHLCGGRLILGLGVSGPQVVEGWYGQPFAKPLARMREYIGILRDIWAREGPVTNDGAHYPLPLPGRHRPRQAAEVEHPSAALRHPDLPRRRGAEEHRAGGRAVRRVAGAVLLAPSRRLLPRCARRGARPAGRAAQPGRVRGRRDRAADHHRRRRGGGRRRAPDVRAVLRRHGRPRDRTSTPTSRSGWATRPRSPRSRSCTSAGHKAEAAAAVPTKLVEQLTLIGPKEKIRHELEAWRESIVTTVLVGGDPATLRSAAELVLGLSATRRLRRPGESGAPPGTQATRGV